MLERCLTHITLIRVAQLQTVTSLVSLALTAVCLSLHKALREAKRYFSEVD